MNYAVWESVDAFRTAFENPEFRRQISEYPPSAVSRPHLFRKVSVPGNCEVKEFCQTERKQPRHRILLFLLPPTRLGFRISGQHQKNSSKVYTQHNARVAKHANLNI